MRKPLIAGNWKMYKTINEAVDLTSGLKKELAHVQNADVVVCPVFTALHRVFENISDTDIALGAQDLYWEKEGAFTGEISPIMLKDCGCEYVIIGHSERRKYFHETDATVNKKIKAALEVGLIPIMCVGETLEQREGNETLKVVTGQLAGGLEGFEKFDAMNIVIAYEPVWAIGTGKTATPQQAEEVHKAIREWIRAAYGDGAADTMRILYGGSVKPENTAELMAQEDIDGALVGGAALKAASFTDIVKNALLPV